MPNKACPSTDELNDYLHGRLQLELIDEVARHVEECPPCEDTVAQLERSGDTLVETLQNPKRSEFASDEHCREALELVKQFGREASQATAGGMKPGGQQQSPPIGQLREYQLLEKLGEGGMGAVYKARHERLDKIVAVKMLPRERMKDTQAVARFQQQMRAVGKLDHPHIVRALDAGEVDGVHFLVMEYVRGVDLSQLVRRRGRLPLAEACELIRQAAIGLDEAHDQQIVHRDIKPSNLILARRRRKPPVLKILDMGLAMLSEAHSPDVQGLTATGQMMGTLDYMAPEQGGDSKAVDNRADIYALGATLYKLLTGEAIYHGEQYQTPVQKMMALATEPAPPIQSRRPDVPNELAAVVERMLAKNPEDRFADPSEVAEAVAPFAEGADLADLLESVTTERDVDEQQIEVATDPFVPVSEIDTHPHVQSRPATPPPQPRITPMCPRRRRWLIATAVGLLFVALAGWITIKIRQGDRETIVRVPAGAEAMVDADGSVAVELPTGKTEPQDASPEQGAGTQGENSARSTAQKAPPAGTAEDGAGQWIPLLDGEKEFKKWKPEKLGDEHLIEFKDGVTSFASPDVINWLQRPIVADDFLLHWENRKEAQGNHVGLLFADRRYSIQHNYSDEHDLRLYNPKMHTVSNHRGSCFAGRWNQFDAVYAAGRLTVYANGRRIHEINVPREPLQGLRLKSHNGKGQFRNVALLWPTEEQLALIRAGGLPTYPAASMTPDDGWVDLLPHVDAEKGAESGDWWFTEDDGLTVIPPEIQSTAPVTARLATPCVPHGSYELRVAFRRLDTKQQGIGFHLPVFGSSTWLFHGKKAPLTFAHGVDAQAQGLPDNLSLEFLQEKELLIRVDRQGELARVAALVEGVPLFTWKGDPELLAPPDFCTVKPGGLGIGAAGRYTIEKFELRMLDGEAELFPRPNAPRPAQKKSPPDYEPLARSDWIEIPLKEAAAKSNQATLANDLLHVEGQFAALVLEEYAARDLIMRANMRLVAGKRVQLCFGLGTGEDQSAKPVNSTWVNADGTVQVANEGVVAQPKFQPHEWFELAVAVVDDKHRVYINGQQVSEQDREAKAELIPLLGAYDTAQFRKIEVMPLDDVLPEGVFPGGWKLKAVLNGHRGEVNHLAFSPTQPLLATIAWDGTARIWDLNSGKTVHEIKTSSGKFDWALDWSPDGNKLAVCMNGNPPLVKLWDIGEQKLEEQPLGIGNMAAAFSPDGKTVAIAKQNELRLIDVASRKVLWNGETGNLKSWGAHCIVFSPDGSRLLTGGGAKIGVWDAISGKSLDGWYAGVYSVPITDLAFSPDGSRVVAATDGTVLAMLDAKTGKLLRKIQHPPDGRGLQSVAYTPDGRYFASAGDNAVIRVRDANTATMIMKLKGHDKLIREIAFSPDGSLLASCGRDKTVRIWEVPSSKSLTPDDGWLDMLPLVQRTYDADGPWRRYGRGWRADSPGDGGRTLRLPVHPDESSSFEIEAELQTAVDDWCSLVWPDQHGHVEVCLFHDEPTGLRAVNTDQTKTVIAQRPKFPAAKDKPQRLHLKVLRAGESTHVVATLDGRVWIDWQGPAEELTSDRRSPLRFTFADGYLWIKSARLRMLKGEARLLRAPGDF